jgi:dTDP-4-amino-4,6-dideoxygalactose transaminase
MKRREILFSPPDMTEAEIAGVAEVLRSGWITTGPKTKELERRMAEYCHTKKQVCLNSATAAEELNLRILGVGPGDEVIVPAYTYTASASAAIHCGATVIFVDSQKDGDPITHVPEMDYNAVEAAITERTKAIIAVDLGGIMCDYDRIYQAAENKKYLFKASNPIQEALGRVAVVADCAHALGASRYGKMAGEVADFSSFSYHAVKNFTTAEGGAVTWNLQGIDDEALYKQYQLYSLHGQNKDAMAKTKLGAWEYDIVGPWYKCNMTDIMAAIGLRQLDRYPGMLARRKEIIAKYDDGLGIFHLNHYGKDYSGSGHLYLTRIPGIDTEQRNKIIEKLAERGIATNVHYKPLPMMTAYRAYGWDIKDFPNAYDYYHNLITLPLHTKLSDEDVEYVMEMVKEVVGEYID